MRFSLRSSSPMRTAIMDSVWLRASGCGPDASKRHSRTESPAALGVGTAAHDLPLDIQPVAGGDARPRGGGALLRADPVETCAAPDADALPEQPLLGAGSDHPPIAAAGRVGLDGRV